MAWRRRSLLACAAALPLGMAARAQTLDEARVKARLTLTLARYTQWPAASAGAGSDALVLCVAQRSDVLALAFGELAGQAVAGRPVRVLTSPPPAAAGCHVLFVQDGAERDAAALLAAARGTPVLTVGDGDGFVARGGMVELVNVNDAMRLDVNLRALRSARLELSSRVLQLARQVRE
ncbi:YfiR family protein [Piscinibacter defluvii]|uniref:YfiR family protein n=1 Tax=Piscinibacter defluvii TaxID=1796922 RepID=UPI000FDECBB4|nr:YfiR family protein [Piscinibacter defluvii]